MGQTTFLYRIRNYQILVRTLFSPSGGDQEGDLRETLKAGHLNKLFHQLGQSVRIPHLVIIPCHYFHQFIAFAEDGRQF